MLIAVKLHRELRAGSSLPLIVDADDGRRYVVKARGSGDGPLGSLVDWVALRLGRRLGIPALRPVLLQVGPGLERQADDPEVRDLLEGSHGENLATAWVEDARHADFDLLDAETRSDVFLFDLWLLNVDRTAKNPNAIVGPDGFRCLDYSSAMALRGLFSGTRGATKQMLRQIRRNPLYAPEIDPEPFMERLRSISRDELEEIVGEIPASWRLAVAPRLSPARFHQDHIRLLGELLDDATALRRRLLQLRAIPLETEEERRRRSEANQAEFRRRFGKL